MVLIFVTILLFLFYVTELESGQIGPLQTRPTANLAHYNQPYFNFTLCLLHTFSLEGTLNLLYANTPVPNLTPIEATELIPIINC